jgi:hypothetical protein
MGTSFAKICLLKLTARDLGFGIKNPVFERGMQPIRAGRIVIGHHSSVVWLHWFYCILAGKFAPDCRKNDPMCNARGINPSKYNHSLADSFFKRLEVLSLV